MFCIPSWNLEAFLKHIPMTYLWPSEAQRSQIHATEGYPNTAKKQVGRHLHARSNSGHGGCGQCSRGPFACSKSYKPDSSGVAIHVHQPIGFSGGYSFRGFTYSTASSVWVQTGLTPE